MERNKIDLLNPKRISRIHPISMIFWFAIAFFLLGIYFPALKILAIVGVFIMLVYIIYFIVWVRGNY